MLPEAANLGQKTHPRGFRLGVEKNWQSIWFNDKHYANFLHEDLKLTEFIGKKLKAAGVDRVVISRSLKEVEITIFVARPGLVIGRGGERIENLKKDLRGMIAGKLKLNVQEIKNPELSAKLIAEGIAQRIERRFPYKRAVNEAIQKVKEAGAKGIKVEVSGVLSGASSIGRSEKKMEGSVPTSTLNAKIDFARAVALTKYGTIGVKVWINKGRE